MKRAVVAAALALAGCSSCPPPFSSSTLSRTTTLAGAAPATSQLLLQVPSQSCGFGCTLGCGDPGASVTFTFDASWSGAGGAGGADDPVVRFTLAQTVPLPPPPSVEDPPLPVDLLLSGTSTASTTITLAPPCTSCGLDYTLTMARIEHVPEGTVTVAWTAVTAYHSQDGLVLSAMP